MVATIAAGTTAAYYLQQAEYYLGGSEPDGRWTAFDPGFGVRSGDVVTRADFERLHAGLDHQGEQLVTGRGGRAERCAGYDITFSAPKSVSVVWALGDADVRREIEAAQERAVGAALKLLNKEAAFSRRGRNGASLERVQLTVATFQHGESRPAEHEDGAIWGDPQLHTHAVVLNLAHRADGTVGALDGRHLFAHKMAGGAVFHVQLAAELESLGFEIEQTGNNGVFEIVGVDKEVRQHFSARREAIEAAMAGHGLTTNEAPVLAAAVTAASRAVKYVDGADDRHDRWRAEFEKLGYEPDGYVGGLRRASLEQNREAKIARRLALIPRRLTETESLFERRHLIAAVAGELVGTGVDADRATLEANMLVKAGAIVIVGKDALGRDQLSTPEMVNLEREICAMAAQSTQRRSHRIDRALVADAIGGAHLSEEQATAIETVVASGSICAMEGAAGSGKTTTLRPLADMYRRSGYKVIGSAAAWRIANNLRDDLGIAARATDSWIASAAAGKEFLDARTVLIVDEAGQLDSRQMHVLLRQAATSGAKVILVGDREQLQPIGPGAALGLVAQEVGAVRIEAITRQREAWARKAVQAFAKGTAAGALSAFAEKGLLTECDGAAETIRSIADACVASTPTPDPSSCLVLAKTNAQVRALNHEIRARYRTIGVLQGDDVVIRTAAQRRSVTQLPLAKGDQIRFRDRYDELGVVNGAMARIEAITAQPDGEAVIKATVEGRRIRFNTRDLQDSSGAPGKIEYAYASTIYGSQGVTSERSIVLMDPSMTRHDAYVAASRARGDTRLIYDRRVVDSVLKHEAPFDERGRIQPDKRSRLSWLAGKLSRSQQKLTTVEVLEASERARKRTLELQPD